MLPYLNLLVPIIVLLFFEYIFTSREEIKLNQ